MRLRAAWSVPLLFLSCGGTGDSSSASDAGDASSSNGDAAPSDGGGNYVDAAQPGDGGGSDGAANDGDAASTDRAWVMAYYAGYDASRLPVAEIDWAAITHVAVAFYLPDTAGGLDESLFIDQANGPRLGHALVDAAHAS